MAMHTIPDDGAPHSSSSECGCGPRLDVQRGTGRRMYVHIDQRPDTTDDDDGQQGVTGDRD